MAKEDDAQPGAGAGGDDDDQPLERSTMKRTPQTFTDVAAANAHIAAITKQLVESEERADKLEAATDPVAAITKGMTPEQAAIVKADRERIAKLETEAAARELGEQASAIVKNTGADKATVAELLGAVKGNEKLTKFVGEVFSKYDEVLKIAEEGEGAEVGGSGAAEASTAPAAERLEKRVGELMKADPKLQKAQAVSKALEEDPTLYDESDEAEATPGRD